ncbi:hypothetical protein GJ496_004266 [Pomphorhynchus laevis]|nr:hypothetical protein GJ496_004266 [Pomphorhynchus laevis]
MNASAGRKLEKFKASLLNKILSVISWYLIMIVLIIIIGFAITFGILLSSKKSTPPNGQLVIPTAKTTAATTTTTSPGPYIGKKIEAACTVSGIIEDNDKNTDSFQRILCGILADMTEDLKGVPFFIKSSVFDSTTNSFPITIYYKLSEDLSVTASDFVTNKRRDQCPTNNYEFDYNFVYYGLENINDITLYRNYVNNVLAANPTLKAFYFNEDKVYCKGTNQSDECLNEINEKFAENTFVDIKNNSISYKISVSITQNTADLVPITLKKWSEVVTMRSTDTTSNTKFNIKITFTNATDVNEKHGNELQKDFCLKIDKNKIHDTTIFYLKVGNFYNDSKEFEAILYLKYSKNTGNVK